jgi:cytochrome b6-f complex iron-sulfur subunit
MTEKKNPAKNSQEASSPWQAGFKRLAQPMERRTFLKLGLGAIGAAYACLMGYPLYRYLASPLEDAAGEGTVNEVTLDNVLSLPKNSALMFKFGSRPAMLIRHEDDSWTALSAVCTHLGCTAHYQPDKKNIYCPCHGGVYDSVTGANVSGPPPAPLTQFKVRVHDGKITVSRT